MDRDADHQTSKAAPRRVVGVDGGGSKTLARVMSVGPTGVLCAIGEGVAGGSNPLSVGYDGAEAAILHAVERAREAAGEPLRADFAVLAIAGCGAAEVATRMQQWADSAGLAARARVVDDTAPLLAAVAPGEPAIGLIAGTGSSAIAKPATGPAQVLGGWGYLIDDAGSGFDLGQRALRHATHSLDAGADSGDALTAAALEYTESTDPSGFKARVYGAPNSRRFIAGFAAEVLRLAEGGDGDASSVATRGASALAELAALASKRVVSPGQMLPRVFASGGLFERSVFYRRLVVERLTELGWPADSIRLAPDAATGCAMLAARHVTGNA